MLAAVSVGTPGTTTKLSVFLPGENLTIKSTSESTSAHHSILWVRHNEVNYSYVKPQECLFIKNIVELINKHIDLPNTAKQPSSHPSKSKASGQTLHPVDPTVCHALAADNVCNANSKRGNTLKIPHVSYRPSLTVPAAMFCIPLYRMCILILDKLPFISENPVSMSSP